jgi:hypothetical protein
MMQNQRRISPRALAVAMGLLVGLATAVVAAGPPITEEQLPEKIEKATSAADHQALASYYRGEAQAAEKKVAEHETMAARYAGLTGKRDWASHCSSLVAYYRKIAAEYQDLAKLHESQAAALKGE